MFPFIRPQDIADIVIMSFLVYQLYRWFKNTKALQVVIGLGFLGILYIVTKSFGLFMTSWILQELGTVLLILIIVIFQNEIRHALYRISLLRNLFERQEEEGGRLETSELAAAIFHLAAEMTGAIIVFQREEPLDEHLLHGVPLDAVVTPQLLISIFRDGAPLHDGATVIRDGRVVQASCHLPLSSSRDFPQQFGTRHRAGVGLTERSDAVVVIVSEERGEVSLAHAGALRQIAGPQQLNEALEGFLQPAPPDEGGTSLRQRWFSNLGPKVGVFLLVAVAWLVVTARQGGIVSVTVPLKYHNLPENLTLSKISPEEVEVQLKVISGLVSSPRNLDIVADIDLGRLREGTNNLALNGDDFRLPTGVQLGGVNPSVVKVTAEKKVRKVLHVRVRTVGRLVGTARLRKVLCEPDTVTVEGPGHLLDQVVAVETETVDLATVRPNEVVERRILLPQPQLKLVNPDPVRIRIVAMAR